MMEGRVVPKGDSGSPVIDLASITQALLVAECLSFRRAARVLDIRQSAISRRVRALEDVLGVSLFERHHAGVRVTAAGARFFDQARDALLQLDYAVKTAAAAGRGTIGRLDIGILSSMAAGFLREVIRVYRARNPDVALQILEGASVEQLALVRKSRLDVAFVLGTPDVPNCDLVQLWTEQIFVALPQEHILCEYDEINWEVLRNEQFILCQSEKGRALHDHLIKRLAELGHNPSVQRLDVGRETLMHLVALRLGLSLTSEAAVATQFPEVVFRPIGGDAGVIAFSAVWLPNNDNPAFRRFLSLARSVAKQWKQRSTDCAMPHSSRRAKGEAISRSLAFLVVSVQMLGPLT
jgi:DNA-binding transcriptional LysR family regulator